MSSCKLDYIENLHWSDTQEAKDYKKSLYETVSFLAKKLRTSDHFKFYEGKLRVSNENRTRYLTALEYVDGLNSTLNSTDVSLIEDPVNPLYSVAKIDVITPRIDSIKQHLKDEVNLESLPEEVFYNIQEGLFGKTILSQNNYSLTELIDNHIDSLEPDLNRIVTSAADTISGIIPTLSEDSYFNNGSGQRTLLKDLSYFNNENIELSKKAVRYYWEASYRLNYVRKSLLEEDGGAVQALNYINDTNVNDPSLSKDQKDFYNTQVQKLSRILSDITPYSRYFSYIKDLKQALENSGIKIDPFSRYNGVKLETDILSYLMNLGFNELESLDVLDVTLGSQYNSDTLFRELLLNEVVKRKRDIDIDQTRDGLLLLFEGALRKDRNGKVIEKNVFEYLTEMTDTYSRLESKIKAISKEFASKILYDELAKGKFKDLTLDKAKQILSEDLGEDGYLDRMLNAPQQFKDLAIQFTSKWMSEYLSRAHNKSLDLTSSFEKIIDDLDENTKSLINDTFQTERLYLPYGDDLIYLDVDDVQENSQVFTVGGKQFRLLLKRNRFLTREKDVITSNINKRLFYDNQESFVESYMSIVDKMNRDDVYYNSQGDYVGITKEGQEFLKSEIESVFGFRIQGFGKKLRESLYTYFTSETNLNKEKLKINLGNHLYSLYVKENEEELSKTEKESLLKEAHIEALEKDITSSENSIHYTNFEKRYVKSKIEGEDITPENLQYIRGIEEEIDGIKEGYVYVETSGKLEKLYYTGEMGDREYSFSLIESPIVSVLRLNHKFVKPSSKYNNPLYLQIQNNTKLKPIYDKVVQEYTTANRRTESDLPFSMVPQVLEEEKEKSLLRKYADDPRLIYTDIKSSITDATRVKVITLDDVTQIIKAKKSYSYVEKVTNDKGEVTETTRQVEIGDLVDIKGHLILNEQGEKETDETKGARKALFGIDVNGQEIKRINKKYTKELEIDNLESDVLTSLKKFTSHAASYQELKNASFAGNVLLNVLGDRKKIERFRDNQGNLKSIISAFGKQWEEKSLDKIKIASNIIDQMVYGRFYNNAKTTIFGKDYDTHALVGKLQGGIAWSSLAFNIVAPIGNLSMGTMNNLLMAVQGRVLDTETYAKANAFYWKQMTKGALKDRFVKDINKKSFMGQILQKFQIIQGDEFGADLSVKFGFSEIAYWTSTAPEHNIQGTLGIGILMMEDFNGRRVFDILEELYNSTKDNPDYSFNQAVTDYFGEDFLNTTKSKIQSAVRQSQGNYNRLNSAQLQRIAVFNLALIFKKWIWSGFLTRWGRERYSMEDYDYNEGYQLIFMKNLYKGLLDDWRDENQTGWQKMRNVATKLAKGKLKTAAYIGEVASSAITLGKFRLSEIDMYKKILEEEGLSEEEATAMFRAASELTIFLSALLLSGLAYGLSSDDEDDKNNALLTVSYYLYRFQNDSGFFLPYTTIPVAGGVGVFNTYDNAWRILKDPVTIERTIENNMALLSQIVGFYEDEEGYSHMKLFEQYKTSGSTYEKGDYKIWNKLKKTIGAPVYQIERFVNIEDQRRYLDMMRSTSE